MLTQAVDSYLAIRRAPGGAPRYRGERVAQRARRLGIIIRLARYLRAEDQHHDVPPAVFGAERYVRPTPYILSAEQIRQLIAAARQSEDTLQPATYSTLFSLLACTGPLLTKSSCRCEENRSDHGMWTRYSARR